MLELPCPPATIGVGELEWPQEIRSLYHIKVSKNDNHSEGSTYLLEVGAGSRDFVDKVFNTEDVVLAKSLLDDSVVSERDALLVNLAVTPLVDQFTDGLKVGLAEIVDQKKNNKKKRFIHTRR